MIYKVEEKFQMDDRAILPSADFGDGIPVFFAKDKNGYYAINPDGKIRLSVNYDWRRFMRKLYIKNNLG